MAAKKPVVNAFDAIAKPATTAAPSKTNKIAAVVDDKIKEAVDVVINAKAAIAKLEFEKDDAETTIINHVRPQQDKAAFAGNFSKSFAVGGNTGSVTYTTSDKFSVPKEPEVQEALRKCMGDKKFDENFKVVRTISVTPAVTEDTDKINKLVAACTKAGIEIGEYFVVTDVLKAKPDLDRKQYELTPGQLDTFRTLVRQNKPALK
ncbi:MAG: hypothetical protein NT096_00100 [Proteobacteria bacterium]|nr:hypothetical protein [Pseudomonadota bacterium]